MHVLVTRPEPDDAALASELERSGIEVTQCPLLEISYTPVDARVLETAAAVVTTSKNALRSIRDNERARATLANRPVITAGPATAHLARELGASNVVEGTTDTLAVLPIFRQIQTTLANPIVHLCGNHLAVDVVDELSKQSISAIRHIAYNATAKQDLPPELQTALRSGAINAVTLLSPRTATTWLQLVNSSHLQSALAEIWHICNSDRAASLLKDAQPELRVRQTDHPTIEQLVKTVKRLAEPNALS